MGDPRWLTLRAGGGFAAQEALLHPWVREGGDAPDNKIDNEVLKRMKNFAGMQKFKKVGLMLLVRHLKKEEVEGLRQLFMDMDADRSGKITIDELRTGLDRHGARMAKTEVCHTLRAPSRLLDRNS